MLHTDATFSDAVEQAVSRIEARTDAEIVVVAAERSGTYRDLAYLLAAGVTLVAVAGLALVPWAVHPLALVADYAITWGIVAWLGNTRWVVRWLTSATRRQQQVRDAAEAEFHRESVHATPDRTGLLVYVSALEGQVRVLPDAGLEGRVPPGAWAAALAAFAHDDLDHFLEGLDALGELLAEHVPALSTDRVDLPNAPRIRG